MNPDSWEVELEEWLAKGDWVTTPNSHPGEPDILWEDFTAAKALVENTPGLHVYTLVEDEGMWVVEGARWVNRFAYLIGRVKVPIENEYHAIMWWPPDPEVDQDLIEKLEDYILNAGYVDVIYDYDERGDLEEIISLSFVAKDAQGRRFDISFEMVEGDDTKVHSVWQREHELLKEPGDWLFVEEWREEDE